MRALVVLTVLLAGTMTAWSADTFASWATDVRNGRWVKGKPAVYAAQYAKLLSRDNEAKILHAACLLAQLGENASFQAYVKKFGISINYLGMDFTGSQSAPSTWSKMNDLVDSFVKEAVPVLSQALSDLEGIPSTWSGNVYLSKDEYPVDEDVYIDIADVLYARSALESVIGGAYFLQGYDLTVDWVAADKSVRTTERQVPLTASVPSLSSENGWSNALKLRKNGYEVWMLFAGKKLFLRFAGEKPLPENKLAGIDLQLRNKASGNWLDIWLNRQGGLNTWQEALEPSPDWEAHLEHSGQRFVCPDYDAYFRGFDFDTYWQFEYDDRWYELDEDYWNRYDRFEAAWEQFRQKTLLKSWRLHQADGALILECDLSETANVALVKGGYWTVAWCDLDVLTEWRPHVCANYSSEWNEELGEWESVFVGYEEDWFWDVDWTEMDGSDTDEGVVHLLNGQKLCLSKVRNATSLSTSKGWVHRALSRALQADSAVLSRTDNLMHFVEYNQLKDQEALDRGRKGLQLALDSLDRGVILDNSEYCLSLLPEDEVLRVYLGALFSGTVSRDLLPEFAVNEYGEAQYIVETVKDATFGGLLPDGSEELWGRVSEHNGYGRAHRPITVKLDANGGRVMSATYELSFDEEDDCFRYGLIPEPQPRTGYVFLGWAVKKTGGSILYEGDFYNPSDFADTSMPTLYAQWLKSQTLTIKSEDAYFEYWGSVGDFYFEDSMEGKGSVRLLPGISGSLVVPYERMDRTGRWLRFQKWTVTPSTADLGPGFQASSPDTYLQMPPCDVSIEATYIDEEKAAGLCLYPETGDWVGGVDNAPFDLPYDLTDFQWSPDGGKTWYGVEEDACVVAGNCSVTFRSKNPSWIAPTGVVRTTLAAGDWQELAVSSQFSFALTVVPEIVTVANGDRDYASGLGGSVTLGNKNGTVLPGKSMKLTAKPAKGYAFQGWCWSDGDESYFISTSATYDLENSDVLCIASKGSHGAICMKGDDNSQYLMSKLNQEDSKLHIRAVFKALSDYRASDIVFDRFSDMSVEYDSSGRASVEMYGVVGCSLGE